MQIANFPHIGDSQFAFWSQTNVMKQKMLHFVISRWILVITLQKDSILTKKWVNVPATKDVMIPKIQATETGIILSIERTKVSGFGKSERLFINSMNFNQFLELHN